MNFLTAATFLGLDSPFDFILMVILFGGAVSLAHALVAEAGKFARHSADLALKQDLVERGLDIDEVERVVAAGRRQPAPRC